MHCRSSRRGFRSREGNETDIIEGDVLVRVSLSVLMWRYDLTIRMLFQLTRYPCKLPTDVQKVGQSTSLSVIFKISNPEKKIS